MLQLSNTRMSFLVNHFLDGILEYEYNKSSMIFLETPDVYMSSAQKNINDLILLFITDSFVQILSKILNVIFYCCNYIRKKNIIINIIFIIK